jgi:hypothetical protein
MLEIEKYSDFLKSVRSDIRMEVILSELMDDEFNAEDLLIQSNSLFKRNYHFDIERTGEIVSDITKKKKLSVWVNREGIYDHLPEDLFYLNAETMNSDKDLVIQEMKEQQELEKQIRIFFQPFEQEYYQQRIQLELEERKFLFETNGILPGDILTDLWEFPAFLTVEQKSRLGLLMPVIHQFTGKNELLEFLVKMITGDTVVIRKDKPLKSIVDSDLRLGDMYLGMNSTCGGMLYSVQFASAIVIYPGEMDDLMDFMPGGKKILVLQFLVELLMPMEQDFVFEISVPEKSSLFMLEENHSHLGKLAYTTII